MYRTTNKALLLLYTKAGASLACSFCVHLQGPVSCSTMHVIIRLRYKKCLQGQMLLMDAAAAEHWH